MQVQWMSPIIDATPDNVCWMRNFVDIFGGSSIFNFLYCFLVMPHLTMFWNAVLSWYFWWITAIMEAYFICRSLGGDRYRSCSRSGSWHYPINEHPTLCKKVSEMSSCNPHACMRGAKVNKHQVMIVLRIDPVLSEDFIMGYLTNHAFINGWECLHQIRDHDVP